MFSLDKFYYVLYKNLLEPFNIKENLFYPYGSTDRDDFCCLYSSVTEPTFGITLFYDQEPLDYTVINNLISTNDCLFVPRMIILASSEFSELKTDICKNNNLYDWYYFFHGFVALDWYNDFQYIPQCDPGFTKVFINLNHLMTQDRSYRMHLVAAMIEHGLLDHGLVSLPLQDKNGTWKSEIFSPNCKLSVEAKKLVAKHISRRSEPLVVDTNCPQGWLSAEIDLSVLSQALWHVVSETIFFQEKLHLTEKTFKPIVSQRPFILVAAPGNLEYIKSYGFKTFDRWIDESYDQEIDPDKRIAKIIIELKKLCAMSITDLQKMHCEMKPILEHNFRHFYTDFKTKIVHELVDNFEVCIKQYNTSRLPVSQIPAHKIDYEQVKNRLLGIR